MPDGKYYRRQAQLCAHLAGTSSDPRAASRYNQLALEYLAKAQELEPDRKVTDAGPIATRPDGGGSEMDRD